MSHRRSLASFLYPSVVFLGSFLLFAVQPMAGKALLPHFGGSAAVWSASLLFFMTLLLVGYWYVHFLGRLSFAAQRIIQCGIVMASVLFVAKEIFADDALIAVGAVNSSGFTAPILSLLLALLAGIGLPYFVLSTTSSLLQVWYGAYHRAGIHPYRLYVYSNAGAFVGLVSYPFLVEPFTALTVQETIWFFLYLGYALGMAWCLAPVRRVAAPPRESDERQNSFSADRVIQVPEERGIPTARIAPYMWWFILGGLPAFMLLAITNQLSRGIAPVPLLWMLPLALYLLSFIITFRKEEPLLQEVVGLLLFPSVFVSGMVWSGFNMWGVRVEIIIYILIFFLLCVVCHGELYRRRPAPQSLTLFYAISALGSAASGVFINFVAPFVFRGGLWEFPLGLFFALVVAVIIARRFLDDLVGARGYYALSATLCCIFVFTISWRTVALREKTVVALRNFYGPLAVLEGSVTEGGREFYKLVNGATIHGLQFRSAPYRYLPTSYYGETSGVGLALSYHPKRQEKVSLRVGIIGLGAGTIAAYCRGGDSFTFYEINPAVVEIAKTQFDYLAHCLGRVGIMRGDARLAMERELLQTGSRMFDVLAVDAFSDDAIPVHLFTKEAFALYLAHLAKPDGILAVHVSNRYLDLVPVVVKFADHYGLARAVIESALDEARGVYKATWVLLVRDGGILDRPIFRAAALPVSAPDSARLWTDDYSNFLSVLKGL